MQRRTRHHRPRPAAIVTRIDQTPGRRLETGTEPARHIDHHLGRRHRPHTHLTRAIHRHHHRIRLHRTRRPHSSPTTSTAPATHTATPATTPHPAGFTAVTFNATPLHTRRRHPEPIQHRHMQRRTRHHRPRRHATDSGRMRSRRNCANSARPVAVRWTLSENHRLPTGSSLADSQSNTTISGHRPAGGGDRGVGRQRTRCAVARR